MDEDEEETVPTGEGEVIVEEVDDEPGLPRSRTTVTLAWLGGLLVAIAVLAFGAQVLERREPVGIGPVRDASPGGFMAGEAPSDGGSLGAGSTPVTGETGGGTPNDGGGDGGTPGSGTGGAPAAAPTTAPPTVDTAEDGDAPLIPGAFFRVVVDGTEERLRYDELGAAAVSADGELDLHVGPDADRGITVRGQPGQVGVPGLTGGQLTLEIDVDVDGRPVVLTSSDGRCGVTIHRLDEGEVAGSFRCETTVGTDSAEAEGSFRASRT